MLLRCLCVFRTGGEVNTAAPCIGNEREQRYAHPASHSLGLDVILRYRVIA